MKRLISLLMCLSLFCIPAIASSNSDGVVLGIELFMPRFITVTVTKDGAPVPDQLILFNKMHRNYLDFKNKQPFEPGDIERYGYTDKNGRVFKIVFYGRQLITPVGYEEQEKQP